MVIERWLVELTDEAMITRVVGDLSAHAVWYGPTVGVEGHEHRHQPPRGNPRTGHRGDRPAAARRDCSTAAASSAWRRRPTSRTSPSSEPLPRPASSSRERCARRRRGLTGRHDLQVWSHLAVAPAGTPRKQWCHRRTVVMASSSIRARCAFRRGGRLNPAPSAGRVSPCTPRTCAGVGRNKRWEYWAIQAPTHVLAVTVSDLDYAAMHAVYFLAPDGSDTAVVELIPLGRCGCPTPAGARRCPSAPRTCRSTSSRTRPAPGSSSTRRASAPTCASSGPPGTSRSGVVVPWSDRRFQYTVKENTLPARGTATVDGAEPLLRRGLVGHPRPRARQVAPPGELELGLRVGNGRAITSSASRSVAGGPMAPARRRTRSASTAASTTSARSSPGGTTATSGCIRGGSGPRAATGSTSRSYPCTCAPTGRTWC